MKMQAIQVTIRILNVPQIYTPQMIRNIITAGLEENPWRQSSFTVQVEMLGDVPDLNSSSILSDEEIHTLRELQEELRKRRDSVNDLLENIANRISNAAEEGND